MSFDPEAFFNSLKKEIPTDPYYTMTFETYLRNKNLWEKYKDRLENKFDMELSRLRFKYNEKMHWRMKKLEALNSSKSAHEIIRKGESDSDSD